MALVNEHLPQIAGQALVNDVLAHGNRFYRPPAGDAFMPIEFGAAAYRFGHSMVRPSYRANFTSGTGDSSNPAADPFFALVFDATEPDFSAPVELRPRRSARRLPGPTTLHRLADVLRPRRRERQEQQEDRHHDLERAVHPSRPRDRPPHPDRPDGAAAAQPAAPAHLGTALWPGRSPARWAPKRSPSPTSRTSPACTAHSRASTPLWYYVLAEAKALAGGLNLGPVGGRIVAETLIGLLRADPTSYLSAYPRFQPFLGTDLTIGPTPDPSITGNRSYTRAHFLHYARVLEAGLYR